MNIYLGMDVGGTKTDCLIASASGDLLGFGRAGSGSYEYHGVEHAGRENRLAVERALDDAGLTLNDITAVGLGVAGADLPEDFEMLEQHIYTPLFGTIPRDFRNDSMAALRGGTAQRPAIVIICGTGANSAGVGKNNNQARAGGLGVLYGDACTGVTLGEEGLKSVWRARDGIIPYTKLTDLFLERAGCADADALFQGVYRGAIPPETLEPMAQLVFHAAVDGDPVACDILERGGTYLGAMINAVAAKLNLTHESFAVVLVGSVFSEGAPVLMEALSSAVRSVRPGAQFRSPEYMPIVGALLMAMDMDEAPNDTVYEALENSFPVFENKYGINLKVPSP
jgi:N-acetylglucosamine kinase-like BadF-type ATPase